MARTREHAVRERERKAKTEEKRAKQQQRREAKRKAIDVNGVEDNGQHDGINQQR
jgi:hypothetical protein